MLAPAHFNALHTLCMRERLSLVFIGETVTMDGREEWN